MNSSGWLLLIVAVVVIAAIVAGVVMMGRQRKTKQAEHAESMRSEAGEQSRLVEQRESKAAEVEATARAAQAESDAKAAEAKRLALAAERQKEDAAKQRSEVDNQLREADEIDPHHDNKNAQGDPDGPDQTPGPQTITNDDRNPPRSS